MEDRARTGMESSGFLIDPGEIGELEASAPYRRSMKVLVDETVFPGAPLCMALVTYPAGASCPLHSHSEAVEVYYVLDGELVATLDGESIEVHRGKMVYIPPRTEHRAENRTGETCRFLAVHAPPVSDLAEVRKHWKSLNDTAISPK